MLENIISEVPRTKLAEATETDPTLATARSLADSQSEGYYWQEGLLFRTRLDKLGVVFAWGVLTQVSQDGP